MLCTHHPHHDSLLDPVVQVGAYLNISWCIHMASTLWNSFHASDAYLCIYIYRQTDRQKDRQTLTHRNDSVSTCLWLGSNPLLRRKIKLQWGIQFAPPSFRKCILCSTDNSKIGNLQNCPKATSSQCGCRQDCCVIDTVMMRCTHRASDALIPECPLLCPRRDA